MSQDQPTDKATQPPAPEEPHAWKPATNGIWLRLSSGICYERPVIDGAPTYRSVNTRNLDEAQKEFYRRRAKGDASCEATQATTVGEVILNYKEAGYYTTRTEFIAVQVAATFGRQ